MHHAFALLLLLAALARPPIAIGEVDMEPAQLRSGAFALVPDATPPPDTDPRWTPIALPDRWDTRQPDAGGPGWYRFDVSSRLAPEALAGLLLTGVNMNAEAFVNGVAVGTGGSMTEPVARNANRPLYWTFPGMLLQRETNRVAIRLFAYAGDVGALGGVALGPDTALRPEYARRHFAQVELPQTTSALVLLLALFFGVLWVAAGREPIYGWFALSAAAWFFVSLNYWIQQPGVSHWVWVRAFYLGLGTFAVTLPIWAHRLRGIRRRGVERILISLLGSYAVVAVALDDATFPFFVTPVQALWFASGTYGVAVLVAGWRSYSRWEAGVYGLGGFVCTVLAAAEQVDAWGWGQTWRPHLMPYIGTVLVVCLSTTLGVRFARSLQSARLANLQLEERVRVKTRELEDNHARVRDLERAQVLADERARIMREMHDGLGGQLVATLAMVQSGTTRPEQIANALRAALDDMRSVIDSMDPLVDDLGKLLGSIRARFEALLRRNDLRFVWQVDDLPPTPWLGPEQYLHLLRVLQEAVANAIQHAQPEQLEVRVHCTDDPEPALILQVRDDGVARESASGGGRGLAHMKRRADALGGVLSIRALDPGTCVELRLPAPRNPG